MKLHNNGVKICRREKMLCASKFQVTNVITYDIIQTI